MSLRLGLLFRLARRDLLHGWQAAGCLCIAVTVALLPLLLLYALKFGVVNNMISSLRDDPRVREIRLMRDTELTEAWFADLADDPRVAFLLPRARYLAGSVRLRGPDSRSMLDSRMIPSVTGDPYLAGGPAPAGLSEAVLTERAAIETGVRTGGTITFVILRTVGEQRESLRHEVTVVGTIPRDLLQTDDVFVAPELEGAIERWREGFAVPELGWESARAGTRLDAGARSIASFRLFARDVRDVPGLRDRLLQDGLDVETRASAVETALEIETGLTWIFFAISSLASAGFLLTLGLHLAASVVEKSRELSLLRLLGLSSAEISLMPSLQGMMIALTGSVAAALIALGLQPLINRGLEGLAGLSGRISEIAPHHLLVATLTATAAGAAAGCLAGYRAARLEPTKGLRHD
ncbi:FtsX-like permease family protein [Pseudooceanicola sp. 216_PA32_1]|uniref:FtsX-like permease family protein n=1 Tax=Pseudooceanicola pacificus TaxID=2676438 RepID=A0A844W2K3_9RHOB|nr:FtsX-like permease family protein [Pseudooceanicola pacificus]MWB77051.1 FtsX-like permease family protein [Pseudooceanicola pacificus]